MGRDCLSIMRSFLYPVCSDPVRTGYNSFSVGVHVSLTCRVIQVKVLKMWVRKDSERRRGKERWRDSKKDVNIGSGEITVVLLFFCLCTDA
jgi:hypothetical protein